MVVNSFRNLIEELEKRSKEFEERGEKSRSLQIKEYRKQLQELYDKIDPEIINSPTVLEFLHDTLYVWNQESNKDFLNIKQGDNGSIYIELHRENDKENQSAEIILRKEEIGGKKYIVIDRSIGTLSEKTTEFGKTEQKTQYLEDIYTLDGLQMEKAETTVINHLRDKFDSYSDGVIRTNMYRFKPIYHVGFGFYSQDRMEGMNQKIATRGKYFGDEENIGLKTLSIIENDKNKTYKEPVDFYAYGPVLSFDRHKGIEIEVSGNSNEEILECAENGNKKFGGFEKGWKRLSKLSRIIPTRLRALAEKIVNEREKKEEDIRE